MDKLSGYQSSISHFSVKLGQELSCCVRKCFVARDMELITTISDRDSKASLNLLKVGVKRSAEGR